MGNTGNTERSPNLETPQYYLDSRNHNSERFYKTLNCLAATGKTAVDITVPPVLSVPSFLLFQYMVLFVRFKYSELEN